MKLSKTLNSLVVRCSLASATVFGLSGCLEDNDKMPQNFSYKASSGAYTGVVAKGAIGNFRGRGALFLFKNETEDNKRVQSNHEYRKVVMFAKVADMEPELAKQVVNTYCLDGTISFPEGTEIVSYERFCGSRFAFFYNSDIENRDTITFKDGDKIVFETKGTTVNPVDAMRAADTFVKTGENTLTVSTTPSPTPTPSPSR